MVPNEEEVNGEKRKGVISSMLTRPSDDKDRWYMSYYSEYNRCLRMTAWVLRFIKNARCKSQDRVKSELTVSELNHAEEKLMIIVQRETFGETKIKELKSLCIFEDQKGLLHVKTGIGCRVDSEKFKCPILLLYCHPLVDALIRGVHLKLCHAGSQIVLSNLREKFWILKSRKAIRRVLQRCVMCRRFVAKRAIAVPADLPEDRVKDASVFEIVGVDLTGPLILKNEEKAWIDFFTCAVYRAVHFELVTSLSTEAFLQSFRKCISRRGRPAIVYNDNGTNFTGTDNLLKSLDQKRFEEFAVLHRIQWKFNPPTAAWWGGWWERIVRMLKQLLRRVMGRSSLTYEEMTTILCDTEAVINSRPLTYISEDAADLQPLTPAMFLQDVKESGVPELDVLNATSANKRLRYCQRVIEDLRKRFRSEYLGQLVLHKGAKGDNHPVRVGDVVLVGSDNMKRLNWSMGMVIEVFPGKDSSVRVVKVKTATGTLTRPIQRVYHLEVAGPEVIMKEKVKEKAKLMTKPKEIIQEKITCTRSGRIVCAPNKFTA